LKLKQILPGVKSFKDGVKIYEEIYGNKLKDGTLIGFTFEKASNNNISNNVVKNEAKNNNNKDVKDKHNNEKGYTKLTVKLPKADKYAERNKEISEITSKAKKPQTHEIYIREPWLTLMREGFKEVEGRLYKGPVENIKIGDKIIWINKKKNGSTNKLEVIVTKLVKYPDFKSLMFHEKLYRVLPGFPNIRTGNELYESIYPHKAIKQYGALAISFKPTEVHKSNNKELIKKLEENENVGTPPNVETQLIVNNNQQQVNEQQKNVNQSLKKINKDVNNGKLLDENENDISTNSEMLQENETKLSNAIKNPNNVINSAVVASNQLAINANQNKVNKKQMRLVLKGKKKN